MSEWRAWSREASDTEIIEDIASVSARAPASWCFVEGPTCSEFVANGSVNQHIATCWFLRVFGLEGELAARRVGFDREQPWLTRWIGRRALDRTDWVPHELGAGEEQALVLFGEADGREAFVEGTQFRDPFRYPGVPAHPLGSRASLMVNVHPAGDGGPVVRWVSLRPLRTTPDPEKV